MNEDLRDRMQAAWDERRASFDAAPDEKQRLLEETRREFAEIVALTRASGPPADLAQALHLQANLEVDLDHPERARPLWEEAIALLRGLDEPLQLAHKVRHLGDLERHAGRLEAAEAAYEEALALYRKHAPPGSLDFANAMRRMALLREQQDRSPEALAAWRETRELYDAVGLEDGVTEADDHLRRLAP